MRRWQGFRVELYSVAVRPGEPAGLHSGHFLAAVPTHHGRGACWVSVHGNSRQPLAANIERLMQSGAPVELCRRRMTVLGGGCSDAFAECDEPVLFWTQVGLGIESPPGLQLEPVVLDDTFANSIHSRALRSDEFVART